MLVEQRHYQPREEGDSNDRLCIVMLSRGGLRVQEALALSEHDLDPQRGSYNLLVYQPQ